MEQSKPERGANRSTRRMRFGGLVGGLSLLTPMVAWAASVETFVLAIGGQAQLGPHFECATSGPATPALTFFPNTTPGVPVEGLAFCGLAGLFRTTTLTGDGPLSDVTSLSTTFGNVPKTFSGSALALARAGSVLTRSNGTYTGAFESLVYEGTASYGIFEDKLTATSPSVPNGTSGTIRLTFHVAGEASVAGPPPANSTADVEINYSVAGGPSFTLLRAQATRSDVAPFAIAGTGAPLTGFTVAPGSFSGAGDVAGLFVPFTWGQPFNLKVGILASTIPGPNLTALVDFTGGATLTGIELRANDLPVTGYTLTSESGTPYGPNGVPEPSTVATTLAGVASLAGLVRGRAGHASR